MKSVLHDWSIYTVAFCIWLLWISVFLGLGESERMCVVYIDVYHTVCVYAYAVRGHHSGTWGKSLPEPRTNLGGRQVPVPPASQHSSQHCSFRGTHPQWLGIFFIICIDVCVCLQSLYVFFLKSLHGFWDRLLMYNPSWQQLFHIFIRHLPLPLHFPNDEIVSCYHNSFYQKSL